MAEYEIDADRLTRRMTNHNENVIKYNRLIADFESKHEFLHDVFHGIEHELQSNSSSKDSINEIMDRLSNRVDELTELYGELGLFNQESKDGTFDELAFELFHIEKLIAKNRISTIDEVPEKLRDDVSEYFDEDGHVDPEISERRGEIFSEIADLKDLEIIGSDMEDAKIIFDGLFGDARFDDPKHTDWDNIPDMTMSQRSALVHLINNVYSLWDGYTQVFYELIDVFP